MGVSDIPAGPLTRDSDPGLESRARGRKTLRERIDLSRVDASDVFLRGAGTLLRLPPHGGLGTLPSWIRIREQIEQQFPRPARLDLRWKDQIAIMNPDGRNSSG